MAEATNTVTQLPTKDREIDRAYSEYRDTRARWYAAEFTSELNDEDGNTFCEDNNLALRAFMFTPCENLSDLACKLETFREDDMCNHTFAEVFIAQLAADARQLALRAN